MADVKVVSLVLLLTGLSIGWYAAHVLVEKWRDWRARKRIEEAMRIIFSKSLTEEEINQDSELSKWVGQVEDVIPGPSVDGGRLFTLASENESDVHD